MSSDLEETVHTSW